MAADHGHGSGTATGLIATSKQLHSRDQNMSKLTHQNGPEADAGVRSLSSSELKEVTGGVSINPFTNEGCIKIVWGPGPAYNPWLDPYSPERRQA
jgi:hypothetical protein